MDCYLNNSLLNSSGDIEMTSPTPVLEMEIQPSMASSSFSTPKGKTFDPFLPGSSSVLMHAPMKKSVKKSFVHFGRKLDFDDVDSDPLFENGISEDRTSEMHQLEIGSCSSSSSPETPDVIQMPRECSFNEFAAGEEIPSGPKINTDPLLSLEKEEDKFLEEVYMDFLCILMQSQLGWVAETCPDLKIRKLSLDEEEDQFLEEVYKDFLCILIPPQPEWLAETCPDGFFQRFSRQRSLI